MKKKIVICGVALLASLSPALGAEPVGEWVVEDGVARVRIVDCDTHLWGVISWEKQVGGVDAENPDKAKRTRPTLGIPILLNMKKAPPGNGTEPEQWTGKVYNAQNGKLYDAKVKLLSADKLELKGCVLGFLCGGQTWTRYVDPAVPPPAPSPPAAPAGSAKAKSAAAAKTVAPVDPAAEICSLPDIAGAAH
jgi:uncharacterized protein (DUF2147 family)